MAKIERKYMAHFINAAKEGEAVYERLGQDLEEFSPEMSAQVETKKNILGETNVDISDAHITLISYFWHVSCIFRESCLFVF